MYWGALAHLYLYKQTYETRAQRMLAAQDDVARQKICGEECWVLSSEQVAFHPCGKVLAISSWNEKKRFDTYFISAEHLTGDWYLGHFGD